MTKPRKKTAVIELDLDVIGDVIERSGREALSSDDVARLESLKDAFVKLGRLVHERGTTIARLRRLFSLQSSERLDDVLHKTGSAESTASGDATNAGGEDATPNSTDTGAGDDDPDSAENPGDTAPGHHGPTNNHANTSGPM